MTEIKMQEISIEQKLLSIKPTIVEYQAEYKKAIKEKEEIINKCQQEILELRKVFGETFGSELVDPTTEFTLRTKPRKALLPFKKHQEGDLEEKNMATWLEYATASQVPHSLILSRSSQPKASELFCPQNYFYFFGSQLI